jgi:hypothetical protein
MPATVHVVHCIDTEGPLHESVEATFERLHEIFGLDLEPSISTLRQLQAGTLDLAGLETEVKRVVDAHLLTYNDTWDKVDAMLARALSESFRAGSPDSLGGSWVYNWFCVDHVDYDTNPRRRDVGYHNIFDHYRSALRAVGSTRDGVHFHYHPHSFLKEAHRCATHWWAASDSLYQVLARRVIDRQWFPAAHRAGFHVIRPDSHWFLEQFIPFDFSNQSVALSGDDTSQFGVTTGRFGDWRRAPATWTPYRPAADDYQTPGTCRRWIARCLNVGTRYRVLTDSDVRQAFKEAGSGRPVVLAFTNHDFRDIRPDVDRVCRMLTSVAREFDDVSFRYCEAVEACRGALGLRPEPPCELDIRLRPAGRARHVIEISSATPTFGPQPWLALKTSAGTYHHDNLDIEVPFHRWEYVLDSETFCLDALEAIGVAANNAYGVTTVARLDARTGAVTRAHWNLGGRTY